MTMIVIKVRDIYVHFRCSKSSSESVYKEMYLNSEKDRGVKIPLLLWKVVYAQEEEKEPYGIFDTYGISGKSDRAHTGKEQPREIRINPKESGFSSPMDKNNEFFDGYVVTGERLSKKEDITLTEGTVLTEEIRKELKALADYLVRSNDITLTKHLENDENFSLLEDENIGSHVKVYRFKGGQTTESEQSAIDDSRDIKNEKKYPNYELLNLIGYGLAKFDRQFIREFNCASKTQFCDYIVKLGIAESPQVVKQRQDLLDPFFDNGRKGWQRGNTYIHRKRHIDSLFGDLTPPQYAEVVKLYIGEKLGKKAGKPAPITRPASPIIKSRFKQLQLTGRQAEFYFASNYESIAEFSGGALDDARLFGDGYDYHVQQQDKYYLAEVKGVQTQKGAIRLTDNEYKTAQRHKNNYGLIVVSNLREDPPKMTAIFNPVKELKLERMETTSRQVSYHSDAMSW